MLVWAILISFKLILIGAEYSTLFRGRIGRPLIAIEQNVLTHIANVEFFKHNYGTFKSPRIFLTQQQQSSVL